MSAPPLLKPFCQLSVLSVLCAVNAGAGGLTEEILQLSGVGAGVCVWLEPGECQGLAELARGRTFLVHGICSEAKAAAAARQRLAGEGLAGIASVEALPLNALPHANNLVNLLVAEDLPPLLKKGLTPAEVRGERGDVRRERHSDVTGALSLGRCRCSFGWLAMLDAQHA